MIEIVQFVPEHLQRLNARKGQAVSGFLTDQYADLLAQHLAFTAEEDRQVIACAGIVSQLSGIGTFWTILGEGGERHLIRFHKVMQRILSIPKLRRIEASTETYRTNVCRWLELLDFQSEGVMRSYGPDGSDHVRYARCR